MTIAIDPIGERGFITEDDKALPEEQQTEFRVRDMTQRQRATFMDSIRVTDDGDGNVSIGGGGARVNMAVQFGLIGVSEDKPLRDSKGEAVPFEKKDGKVSDAFLARIGWPTLVAIANEITSSFAMNEDDTEK